MDNISSQSFQSGKKNHENVFGVKYYAHRTIYNSWQKKLCERTTNKSPNKKLFKIPLVLTFYLSRQDVSQEQWG